MCFKFKEINYYSFIYLIIDDKNKFKNKNIKKFIMKLKK